MKKKKIQINKLTTIKYNKNQARENIPVEVHK